MCTKIDAGMSLDVVEQDAATNNKVDDIRDLVDEVMYPPHEGKYKVYILDEVHMLSTGAVNAFLKTLEEPLGQVRIILMSENAHRLLPTIRSRCLGAALPWPAQDAALAWLQTQLPKTPVAQLQTALQAAGGRAWDAVAWLDSPLAGRWPSLPRALAQGQVAALADCSPKQAVDALQKLAHDLWAVKVHAAPRYFQAADLPRPPSAQALLAWGQQLLAWARSIEHPYKTDLLLEDMVAQTAVLWKSTGQRGGKSLR